MQWARRSTAYLGDQHPHPHPSRRSVSQKAAAGGGPGPAASAEATAGRAAADRREHGRAACREPRPLHAGSRSSRWPYSRL